MWGLTSSVSEAILQKEEKAVGKKKKEENREGGEDTFNLNRITTLSLKEQQLSSIRIA